MAYEDTTVSVARSHEMIRTMVYKHRGSAIAFLSARPKEGFEATVRIGDRDYRVRIMATCKPQRNDAERDREERRVWRVLYWHLKAMFEAADSGVISLLDVILPFVVMPDDRTISEHLTPKLTNLQLMEKNEVIV